MSWCCGCTVTNFYNNRVQVFGLNGSFNSGVGPVEEQGSLMYLGALQRVRKRCLCRARVQVFR